LSAIDKIAARARLAAGLNPTDTVPLAHTPPIVNEDIVSAALPLLLNVTVSAGVNVPPLEEKTVWVPHPRHVFVFVAQAKKNKHVGPLPFPLPKSKQQRHPERNDQRE
jgi:hypothetical protein